MSEQIDKPHGKSGEPGLSGSDARRTENAPSVEIESSARPFWTDLANTYLEFALAMGGLWLLERWSHTLSNQFLSSYLFDFQSTARICIAGVILLTLFSYHVYWGPVAAGSRIERFREWLYYACGDAPTATVSVCISALVVTVVGPTLKSTAEFVLPEPWQSLRDFLPQGHNIVAIVLSVSWMRWYVARQMRRGIVPSWLSVRPSDTAKPAESTSSAEAGSQPPDTPAVTQSTAPESAVRNNLPPLERRWPQRLLWLGASAAACCAVLTLGVAVRAAPAWLGEETYAQPFQLRSIALPDGSTVDLDAHSELHTRFSPFTREMLVVNGQVFVKPVHSWGQSFVVRGGKLDQFAITPDAAVNGEFVVKVLTPDSMEVWPVRGSLSLKLPAFVRLQPNPPQMTLSPGQLAKIERNNVEIQTISGEEQVNRIAWTVDQVIFRQTPLADAVAELNRYTSQTAVIADPRLEKIQVTGSYRIEKLDVLDPIYDLQYKGQIAMVDTPSPSGSLLRLMSPDGHLALASDVAQAKH